jgi:hypothetical protein
MKKQKIVSKKHPLENWNWEQCKGEKVSILIDNPLPERCGKGKESYVGKISEVKDGFLFLDTPENYKIFQIVIRLDHIVSIWRYK